MEKFTENNLKERDAIKKSNVLDIFKNSLEKKGYDLANQFITPYDGKDVYDALQIYTKYHNDKTDFLRMLIEVKVRTEVYDEMFLEVKKWKSLKKIQIMIGGTFKLLYINYTPKGTYIFDVTEIEKYKKDRRLMNEYTSKESKKVMKPVFLLPIEQAKFVPFVYDDKTFKPDYKKEIEQVITHRKLYDIFGQIMEIDKVHYKEYEKKAANIELINVKNNISYFEFERQIAEKFKELDEAMYGRDEK